jgi:hypothetical protein
LSLLFSFFSFSLNSPFLKKPQLTTKSRTPSMLYSFHSHACTCLGLLTCKVVIIYEGRKRAEVAVNFQCTCAKVILKVSSHDLFALKRKSLHFNLISRCMFHFGTLYNQLLQAGAYSLGSYYEIMTVS